jgi:hypothetical protein
MASPSGGFSRRQFLAGSAGLALLSACGSGGSKNGTASASGDLTLVQFFASEALRPGSPQRLPLAIANSDGSLIDQMPAQLTFTVTPSGGQPMPPVTVATRSTGLPRAYLPLEFTPPQAGIYDITASYQGSQLSGAVEIPDQTAVPSPGQAMIPVATPTMANPQGVELVCTKDPPCPLHDVSLADALAANQPVAWLVATPRFCQQAICGPVLDVLVAQKDKFPGVKMLHNEVYVSVAAAQGQLAQSPSVDPTQALQAAVQRYALTYEPVLFLAKPGGAIAERLDVIFDESELEDALKRLLG